MLYIQSNLYQKRIKYFDCLIYFDALILVIRHQASKSVD